MNAREDHLVSKTSKHFLLVKNGHLNSRKLLGANQRSCATSSNPLFRFKSSLQDQLSKVAWSIILAVYVLENHTPECSTGEA